MPKVAIFDNAKSAVTKVLRGAVRIENVAFQAFRSELALEVQFAAPRRGNEKGGVEGVMGYIEDNSFRPVPRFADIDELNTALAEFCTAELQRTHATHQETVATRFARERPMLRPLSEALPRTCITGYARINKFAEATIEANRYSVPTRFAHRDAIVEIYDQRIVILVGGEVAAEHMRANARRQSVINPLHYTELLSHKHRSSTRALAFAHDRLPEPLLHLRAALLEREPTTATKTWMAVLRLAHESSLDALADATEIALARGTLDPHAIALLLKQRNEPDVALAPVPSSVRISGIS